MRPSHNETGPYNQLIEIEIAYFKIASDCFKVISNHSKTMKSAYLKSVSDHFRTKSVYWASSTDIVSFKNQCYKKGF